MCRIQNSDTQDTMFSIVVLEEEREAIAASVQNAIREVVGRQVLYYKTSHFCCNSSGIAFWSSIQVNNYRVFSYSDGRPQSSNPSSGPDPRRPKGTRDNRDGLFVDASRSGPRPLQPGQSLHPTLGRARWSQQICSSCFKSQFHWFFDSSCQGEIARCARQLSSRFNEILKIC